MEEQNKNIQNNDRYETVEVPQSIKRMIAYITSGRNKVDNVSENLQKTFDFRMVYVGTIAGVAAIVFCAAKSNDLPMFNSKIMMSQTAAITAPAVTAAKDKVKTQVIEGFEGVEGIDKATGKATVSNKVAQQKQYIAKYSKVAIAEMDKFGIPASITMAQGILESDAEDSKLSKENNNHFGLKCFSKTCAVGHCTEINLIHDGDFHKDHYLKFSNAVESFRVHSNFLKQPRYTGLFQFGKNYKSWAMGLQQCGYASDKNYGKKLISLIEKYGLNKLDDL